MSMESELLKVLIKEVKELKQTIIDLHSQPVNIKPVLNDYKPRRNKQDKKLDWRNELNIKETDKKEEKTNNS